MNDNKTGRFIAKARKENGLTQEQLGDILSISSKSISKWERGVSFPDSSILCDLSKALNVDVVEILKGERLGLSKKRNKSKGIINNLNIYNKTLKKEVIKILILIILILIVTFQLIIVFNN